ncbi:MAG TPA: hypothetical protein IAA17_09865 [Candidatus Lachnoclostridium stercorigallinarum]|uniref:Uncharacterized protein n=1 Tax=Candidatus Lachnoclostridium stercorigallinarum TaxID=2838634 RepID=A0A9D2K6U3_9FIRM|nr:hypothetical protein [Candidatus Lachnoclostridium stercorigallinarum]
MTGGERKAHVITIAGAGSARVPAMVGTLINYKERFPVSRMISWQRTGSIGRSIGI